MTAQQRNRLIFGSIISAFLCAVVAMLALAVIRQPGIQAAAGASQTAAVTARPVETPNQAHATSAYIPPELDAFAQPIGQSDLSKAAQTLRNENYGITLYPPFALDAEGQLRIDFANPADNRVWLLLDVRLASDNLLLYRTGRIAPGQALTALSLSAEAADILRAQGDGVELSLCFYSFELESFASMGELSFLAPVSIRSPEV